MKIFVTGSTGSIGQHLVKKLSEQGHTIHALVRSLNFQGHTDVRNIHYFKGELSDALSIDNAIKGCEQVYHLAAFAKVWSKNTNDYYNVNVEGTVNILTSSVKNKVQKMVVTSTAGIFGPSMTSVVNEQKKREKPYFTDYERSKAEAETRIKEFVLKHDFEVVVVSPTRVYGPILYGPLSSTTLLIDQYVNHSWRVYPGTGKEIGNYVFMEDVVNGHILAMEKGKKGETYLLGGENESYETFFYKLAELSGVSRKMIRVPISFQLFFAKIQLVAAERFGIDPKITPPWITKGIYNWEVSSEKAINELGFQVTPLSLGLKKTIDFLQKR